MDTIKVINKIQALHKKQTGTLAELERSLKLQQFFPDVFKQGACKVHVRGNVRFHPKSAQFIITLGDGTEHVFPFLETPHELWPAEVKSEFLISRFTGNFSTSTLSNNPGSWVSLRPINYY